MDPVEPPPDAGPQVVPDAGSSAVPDAGSPPDAGAPQPDAGPVMSYSADIQPIWNTYCNGCHAASQGQRPVLSHATSFNVLTTQTSIMCFEHLENGDQKQMPYVTPGDPTRSAMLYVIAAESSRGGCLTSMPKGTTGLEHTDPAAVQRIREWIEQGAQNN
jgi:hypothetical protein